MNYVDFFIQLVQTTFILQNTLLQFKYFVYILNINRDLNISYSVVNHFITIISI